MEPTSLPTRSVIQVNQPRIAIICGTIVLCLFYFIIWMRRNKFLQSQNNNNNNNNNNNSANNLRNVSNNQNNNTSIINTVNSNTIKNNDKIIETKVITPKTLEKIPEFTQFTNNTSRVSGSSEQTSNSKIQITPQNLFMAPPGEMINKAFIYIKPNANTPLCTTFIKDYLKGKGFQIIDEKYLKSDELRKAFDQNFIEISKKAVGIRPSEITLSQFHLELFESKYGIKWKDALEQGLIQNAKTSCEILNITYEQLNNLWIQSCQSDYMLQISDDCWISLIERVITLNDGLSNEQIRGPALFCVNGFYPAMKNKYILTSKSNGVWCCNLVWNDHLMNWKTLIDDVIGISNPQLARESSIRNIIYHEWKDLGLESCPLMEDNSIHVSQSAFEACVERFICFNTPISNDPLGSKLYEIGVTPLIINEWIRNGLLRDIPIFEHLKGLGCKECLSKIKQLSPKSYQVIPFEENNIITHKHSSFLFFQPDSCTPLSISLTREKLCSEGCIITKEGEVNPGLIEKENLFDKQYQDIINYAEYISPSQIQLSAKLLIKFQKKYHLSWIEALNEEIYGIYNSIELMKKFKLSSEELYKLWIDSAESGKVISFSSYFYCSQFDMNDPSLSNSNSKLKIFCINGFYPLMKEKYSRLNSIKLYYMCIEWDFHLMNWNQFINLIVGDVNPSLAYSTSLRGLMNIKWKELNIIIPPNSFDNNLIHFSTSAWDNMIERSIWLSQPYYEDKLYQQLLSVGISNETILHWISTNTYNDSYDIKFHIGGNSHRLSDIFSHKGINECVKIALEILASPLEYDNQSYISSPTNNLTIPYYSDSPSRLPPLNSIASPYKYYDTNRMNFTENSIQTALPSHYSSPISNQPLSNKNYYSPVNYNDITPQNGYGVSSMEFFTNKSLKKVSPIPPRPYSARYQELKSSSIESFPDFPSSRSKRDYHYHKAYTNPLDVMDESRRKRRDHSPQKDDRKKYDRYVNDNNDNYNYNNYNYNNYNDNDNDNGNGGYNNYQSSPVKVIRKGTYSSYEKGRGEDRRINHSESSRKYSNSREGQVNSSNGTKIQKEVRVRENSSIENQVNKSPNTKVKNRRQTGFISSGRNNVNNVNNNTNNNTFINGVSSKEKSRETYQHFSFSDVSYPNEDEEKEFNQRSNISVKNKPNRMTPYEEGEEKIVVNKKAKNIIVNNVDNYENEEVSDEIDLEEGDIMI